MRILTTVVLMCLMLIGCATGDKGDSQYTDYIEKGKDAYINNDFELAISLFGEAKKINPTSEANDLLNKAIDSHAKENKKATTVNTAEATELSNKLLGEWGQVPSSNKGYYYINIQNKDADSVNIEMIFTQDPPASRYASIEVEAVFSNGAYHFEYEDDGWGNKGNGAVKWISEDEIKVDINQTYRNPEANWSLNTSDSWPKITEQMKKQAALAESTLEHADTPSELIPKDSLGLTIEQFTEAFNQYADIGGMESRISDVSLSDQLGNSQKSFVLLLTDSLSIIGTLNTTNDLIKEVVIGNPISYKSAEDNSEFFLAKASMVGAANPELPSDQISEVLTDLGLYEAIQSEDKSEAKVIRGSVKYQYYFQDEHLILIASPNK
ncbi:hypothetical protein [Cohnella sp. WQ 127256]|uniref:hypothetical protein n=1 Tax=Cohnella sp. WQ 127256 TaxID=2938790 RepID=UPI0021179F1C|nr:hypothetical protein [Cohnella sp. WQ 127256]